MIKTSWFRVYVLIFFSIASLVTVVYSDVNPLAKEDQVNPAANSVIPANFPEVSGSVSYYDKVKPILDSRCVACHSCYDSPCQLKLTSIEGIQRGATKVPVYDHERLRAVEPSRLFIDETTIAGWREKGFFPVLNEKAHYPEINLNNSLIAKFLKLKIDNPLPNRGKLPETIKLDPERTLECPTLEEFSQYQKDYPLYGMPYGLPRLSEEEENTLFTWLQNGAKLGNPPSLSSSAAAEIKKWEQFFNGATLKNQLSARYIYEHLFIGHLHFKGHPHNEFYKLIRSKTPSGQAVDEIKSARPFEEAEVAKFYYRLRPVTSTIVDKDHFVYELDDGKMERFKDLFLRPDYKVSRLPGYDQDSTANPFKTFSELPAMSRYQFLLDDAHYFFAGFIKGPVCMGQAALNVIRDQFWVAFTTPQDDLNKEITQFLAENNQYLRLPASEGDRIEITGWHKFNELQRQYLINKETFSAKVLLKQKPLDLDLIWNGDGKNDNALLTVFRHYDNASVVKGWVGKLPLTAWVVDYPLFERIHYLLVAGYNVYGSAGHQVATRLYMDFLRMEAENNFLQFIPAKQRKILHDSWYQGMDLKIFGNSELLFIDTTREPGIDYRSADYKPEFFQKIHQKLDSVDGAPDLINRCEQASCNPANSSTEQQQMDTMMGKLADLKGHEIHALPEVSFLRIKGDDPAKDFVYTLIRNKKLLNVSFIFGENLRREPEQDTLTVVPGFLGSYPNIFLAVQKEQLAPFIEQLQHAKTNADLDKFYSQYGIRRTNPEIWQYYDWFNKKYHAEQPENAGLFDMNLYENR
ncbi:Fatty acid cis/trans isomerase [Candidatus Methylobacter favarea]|uniref:Fatty acid cis/trans isomerase n=2 Tax=Candidatus Methylobacter favarea TaxID=2707345 RepID=A0A8S0XGR3_9GAMM|nr:Fatty acid cis/trans isomerase [Candidatus Methylobacter favarea]